MAHPSIQICGIDDFQKIERSLITHIISIWHHNLDIAALNQKMSVEFPNAEILFMTFDDIENKESTTAPQTENILSCLEFARALPADSTLLIHCMAGISRSSAIAMTIISEFIGPGSEYQAAIEVQKIRPIAQPNRLILQIADKALYRDGALCSAAAKVFG